MHIAPPKKRRYGTYFHGVLAPSDIRSLDCTSENPRNAQVEIFKPKLWAPAPRINLFLIPNTSPTPAIYIYILFAVDSRTFLFFCRFTQTHTFVWWIQWTHNAPAGVFHFSDLKYSFISCSYWPLRSRCTLLTTIFLPLTNSLHLSSYMCRSAVMKGSLYIEFGGSWRLTGGAPRANYSSIFWVAVATSSLPATAWRNFLWAILPFSLRKIGKSSICGCWKFSSTNLTKNVHLVK